MTGTDPMVEPPVHRRKTIMDWLAKGPFAIAASALQGAMNYVIVLWLSFDASLAATGEYRTLFSCYSLVALAMMQESNKVFIRASVTEDADAGAALFVNKMAFGLLALLALVAASFVGLWTGAFHVDPGIMAVVAVGVIVFACDFYIAELQAQRRFQALFLTEAIKYSGALMVFAFAFGQTRSVQTAILFQLGFMALCQFVWFLMFARRQVNFAAIRGQSLRLLRSEPAAQARTYSFANLLPSSVEHVDKLLVGWVFGLEALGVYTLAYSTGRFLYNTLKPAMYVYYRRFVHAMPGWALLRKVTLIFTLFGLALAIAFNLTIKLSTSLDNFARGQWVTTILFCGYGLGILHAVYSQAFSLNKDSIASHSFKAHALATLGSLLLLFAALLSPLSIALVLLALQYPVRDGLSVWLMDRYRRSAS